MENEVNFSNAVKRLQGKLSPSAKKAINNVLEFEMKDTNQTFILDASSEHGKGWFEGSADSIDAKPQVKITITTEDFAKLVFGKLNPMAGMVTGRMSIRGSIKEAIKLDRLLKD